MQLVKHPNLLGSLVEQLCGESPRCWPSLRQSMGNSRARPQDADEVSQRARIRARIEAAYSKRPEYYDRLAKRYGTEVKIPCPAKSSTQAA